MIRITKVEFENYRQYRSISVPFKNLGGYDLHILRAKNGTGKTTFLNGILWCLYEKEYYISDKDKALPIVNNALAQSSEIGKTLNVTVRLTLNDDGEIIVFERTQPYYVMQNPLTNAKSVFIKGMSKLKITKTPADRTANSEVLEDEADVQSLVKQYFDEAIFDYYFFDGESLKNYFIKGKSEKIKSSIFNISQVTLLSNASSHVRAMAEGRNRQVSKLDKESSPSLLDDIQVLEKKIADLNTENTEIEQKIPELTKKIEDAEAALQGYAPIRLNIEKRASIDKELKDLKSEYESFIVEKNAFITKYWTLLNFYPRVKVIYDLIQEKQEAGSLPPNIDKDQIQSLLAEHTANCPICNGVLDERAIRHLQGLLAKLDVSSATSNFLMEIKGGLEYAINCCTQFPVDFKALMEKDKYYEKTINEKKKILDEISAFLTQYSDSTGGIDVKRIEEERKQAIMERSSLQRRKDLNEYDIKRNTEALAAKNAEKDQIEEKWQKKDLLSRQVAIFRKLSSQYDNVQKIIMDEIKEDIQSQTWNRFKAMIWKKNTFGRIAIDDKYELTVYNMDGNQMTGSLSATEYMALAYSFTLAIHDASGKNCPLVVDSPLGRVSDTNRANMAAELLKVSNNKQIIMLFTPDEYSDEVQELYDNHAASIRDISLSDNEEQVKSVGDFNAR